VNGLTKQIDTVAGSVVKVVKNRGKTDIQLSRLEQIAKLLEVVAVADLVSFDRGVIFELSVHNSHTTSYSQQLVNSPYTTTPNLEQELEKARLVIEVKDKEIAYLKEIIELRKKVTTPAN